MNETTISWFSGFTDIDDLARENGYDITESAPVMAIGLSEIFSSEKVKKEMQAEYPDLECLSLGEVWQFQIENILDLIRARGLEASVEWVESFDDNLSQVVYDTKDNLLAVLLATEGGDGILIHLILTADNGPLYQKALLMALQGFLWAVQEEPRQEEAELIVFVAANDNITAVIDRYLGIKQKDAILGYVHTVTVPEDELDPDFLAICTMVEEVSVVQQNIAWKVFI